MRCRLSASSVMAGSPPLQGHGEKLMRARLRWHRTMTIAAAIALIGAVLVHRREVTLLSTLTGDGARAWGWAPQSSSPACSRSPAAPRSAPRRLRLVGLVHEDVP